MTFRRQLFGYNRNDVKKRLKLCENELHDSVARLEAANARIAGLEADIEEYKITVDSVRRQLAQASTTAGAEPIALMIGPTDNLAVISALVDGLEAMTSLTPQFRVYRDGFYRLDGVTTNRLGVIDWLRSHLDVAVVDDRGDALFVQPRGRLQA